MPIGSWNELAIIRESGMLRYYLNGVQIGTASNSMAFSSSITFHFGTSQQTYKELDELRILNYALVEGGASYTPTSVPHDTNLALVLPDSVVPVADEYIDISLAEGSSLFQFESNSYSGAGYASVSHYPSVSAGASMGQLIVGSNGAISNGSLLINASTPSYSSTHENSDYYSSSGSIKNSVLYGLSYSYYPDFNSNNAMTTRGSTDVTMTIVDTNGNCYSYYAGNIQPFTFSNLSGGSFRVTYPSGTREASNVGYSYFAYRRDRLTFSWGSIDFMTFAGGWYQNGPCTEYNWPVYCFDYLRITPSSNSSIEVSAIIIDQGNGLSSEVEKISSVTLMDSSSLNTPTLAVRSDIPVTNYQIGGVRPSIPYKGLVWAMVESGYITSLQIYDGRAWVQCDGRIWTGERWIPFSSYNVVTLSDMYDIADASGQSGYEYIYTDTGFWSWFQKAWLDFRSWTSQMLSTVQGLGSGGGSSGEGAYYGDDIEAVTDNAWDVTEDEIYDTARPSQVFLLPIRGTWHVIKAGFGLFVNVFENVGRAGHVLYNAFDNESSDYAFSFWRLDNGGGIQWD